MEMANITYQDPAGNIKVKVDTQKCINCGRCITACKHNAREYMDDTKRFFDDLAMGVSLSLIAAPAIRTNIPYYKRLFTYLKRAGVKQIYDGSLGADICIWAHIRYIEKNGPKPLITQPCPAIVTYCETFRHDLLDKLSPVHSPMACTAIYMREYGSVRCGIAALSPCIAKSNEFKETGLIQYNITFSKLLKYLEDNDIELPPVETGFDNIEGGMGSIFPMPGGLKENIDHYFGKTLHVTKAEGADVYHKLDLYSETPGDILPDIFDVLNCAEGCNIGSAVRHDTSIFSIDKLMKERKDASMKDRDAVKETYKAFDNLDLSLFLRKYNAIETDNPLITEKDIEEAFEALGKTDHEKQHVDCSACGSATCYHMARKISLGVNIPNNCIVKAMEDAKKEHIENLEARERVASIEKLRETDRLMQVMLESNPQINVLFSNRLEVIDCNPAAIQYMGFQSKEEMLSGFMERFSNAIPKIQSNGKPTTSIIERFMVTAREGFTRFDTEIILGDDLRHLNIEMKTIPYEDSFAIVAYVLDMTDVYKREEELRLARETNELQLRKLDLAVGATNIGLWDMEVVPEDPINPDNVFMWSNEFRRLLGFSGEDDFPNILSSWSDRIHPDEKNSVVTALKRHLLDRSGKTPFDLECRLKKKDGGYAYFRVSGGTVRDEKGNALRVAGAMMDITETKNILLDTERQKIIAEAANQAKSAFLSTMSHEIRTPMNAILGITEIQLQDESLDQNLREAFNKIYISGDMLLSIVNDILDLSKIEAGKLELTEGKYDLASLLSDTAQLNMMRIGSKPIEFRLEVDENSSAYLFGDELRVKQILNNLLSNAFKYTPAGSVSLSAGTEDIRGKKDNIMLVFTVSDTGQGMTQEQIDKLFDEFSRFNPDVNRTTEGTGLGMSITRNLVQMMNGSINIDSEPEKGTTITVRLIQGRAGAGVLGKNSVENLRRFRSLSRAEMKRTQIPHDKMPYGSVLIVDDVDTNIYVAKGLLAPYGLSIDSADSGFSAIEKIKNGKEYDIVFMDHMMPEKDGIETTIELRKIGYKLPIVALTANAVAGQAEIFLENGFDDFISKPIDVRQLNGILKRLIRDKYASGETGHVEDRESGTAKHENIGRADGRNESDLRYRFAPGETETAKHDATNDTSAAPQSTEGGKKPTISRRYAEAFTRDAAKTIAVLEAILEKGGDISEEDMRICTIHVHGMKSALAVIGRMEVSALALKLETNARSNNVEAVITGSQEFIDVLNGIVDEIRPASTSDSEYDLVYELIRKV